MVEAVGLGCGRIEGGNASEGVDLRCRAPEY